MNKSELISIVAGEGSLTKRQASNAVDSVFGTLATQLSRGEPVDIHGFGSFSVKDVAERQGRNPQTGEPVTIAAHKKVAFKAHKAVRDLL